MQLDIQNSIALDELKLEIYFWYGIVFGGIVNFVLLRYLNRKHQLPKKSATKIVGPIDQID